MKAKTAVMFIFALLMACGSAFFASRWLESSKLGIKTTAETGPELTQVVVAAIKIQQFSKIESANVKTISWPKAAVPEGIVTDPAVVTGKFVTQTIQPNEIITQDRLAESGRLSSIIQTGKRAISMRVNDVSGVSGYVLPGTYVDIIVAHKDCQNITNIASASQYTSEHNYKRTGNRDNNADASANEEVVSKDKCKITSNLALSNVKVLAIDQYATTDGAEPKVVKAVTLELTPEDAQVLVKAGVGGDDKTEIRLALRNNGLDNGGNLRELHKRDNAPTKIYQKGNSFTDTWQPGYKEFKINDKLSIIPGPGGESQEVVSARFKDFMAAVTVLQKATETSKDIEGQETDNMRVSEELKQKQMMVECMRNHFSETNGHSLGANICSQRVYGTYYTAFDRF